MDLKVATLLTLLLAVFGAQLVPRRVSDGAALFLGRLLGLPALLGKGFQAVFQVVGEDGAEGRVGCEVVAVAEEGVGAHRQRVALHVHKASLTGKRIADSSSRSGAAWRSGV